MSSLRGLQGPPPPPAQKVQALLTPADVGSSDSPEAGFAPGRRVASPRSAEARPAVPAPEAARAGLWDCHHGAGDAARRLALAPATRRLRGARGKAAPPRPPRATRSSGLVRCRPQSEPPGSSRSLGQVASKTTGPRGTSGRTREDGPDCPREKPGAALSNSLE